MLKSFQLNRARAMTEIPPSSEQSLPMKLDPPTPFSKENPPN